jgi:hypothetical protein
MNELLSPSCMPIDNIAGVFNHYLADLGVEIEDYRYISPDGLFRMDNVMKDPRFRGYLAGLCGDMPSIEDFAIELAGKLPKSMTEREMKFYFKTHLAQYAAGWKIATERDLR